jgi:hypothetical protein
MTTLIFCPPLHFEGLEAKKYFPDDGVGNTRLSKLVIAPGMITLEPFVLHWFHLVEEVVVATFVAVGASFHMNMAASPEHNVNVLVEGFQERSGGPEMTTFDDSQLMCAVIPAEVGELKRDPAQGRRE